MAQLRLRFDHWIPRRLKIEGIVLYPYLFLAKERSEVSFLTLQHEMIHVRQIREKGVARFYFHYLKEYLLLRLKGLNGRTAYLQISFEKEAYRDAAQIELSPAERREIGLV